MCCALRNKFPACKQNIYEKRQLTLHIKHMFFPLLVDTPSSSANISNVFNVKSYDKSGMIKNLVNYSKQFKKCAIEI